MDIGPRLFFLDFLIADPFGIIIPVLIIDPAIFDQKFNGLCGIVRVGIQVLFQPFLRFLIHPHGSAVRAVDHTAPALADGVCKFVPVQQHGDRPADRGKLCGTEVALENDRGKFRNVKLPVIVAVSENFPVGVIFDNVHGGVDHHSPVERIAEVEGAGLQSVRPGGILCQGDDDLFDGRFLPFVVALIILVSDQHGLFGSLIIFDQVIRSRGDPVFSGVETGGIQVFFHIFPGQAGKVDAVTVIFDADLLT